MKYCVYILASKRNGTLYIGYTDNLIRRIYEHKNKLVKGFTEKYNVHILVYYECSDSVSAAMERERQLKNWRRQWKINLINEHNQQWRDLYNDLL